MEEWKSGRAEENVMPRTIEFDTPVQLLTERLKLRQWRPRDLPVFAAMNADPEVMKFFPAPLSRQESDAMANQIGSLITANGWGLWAIERLEDERFIGFVGLHEPMHVFPFSPCVEIGWRLSRDTWGQGMATEAANEALKFAFEGLGLDQVVSFTPTVNARSRAVMERLGMVNSQADFDHPALEKDDSLLRHALYHINRDHW